jgi:hypothetical protein
MPGRIKKVSEGDRPSAERQNAIGQALEQHDTPANGIVDDLGITTRPPLPGSGGGLRLVKVSKDGGVAGTDATNCTWTYTVKTLGGTTMETTISPEQARYPNTTYLQAGTGGRSEYAIAQYVSGTLKLIWVPGEIADTSTCS